MRRVLFLLALCLAAVSCHRERIIPEKELSAIFHDALLVNAYVGQHNFIIDSLNIYEPIFEHYGYTVEDVRHTIASYSRRKNAHLADVAEQMIRRLSEESKLLNGEVAILDTINNVARREIRDNLIHDEHIEVRTDADSVKLRYEIATPEEGRYNIQCRFKIDTADKIRSRRYVIYKMRRDSSLRMVSQMYMQNRNETFTTNDVDIDKSEGIIGLVVELNNLERYKGKRPTTKMDIIEFSVDHIPPLHIALERLFEKQSGLRIFSDTLIRSIERDNFQTQARAEETAEE